MIKLVIYVCTVTVSSGAKSSSGSAVNRKWLGSAIARGGYIAIDPKPNPIPNLYPYPYPNPLSNPIHNRTGYTGPMAAPSYSGRPRSKILWKNGPPMH